MTVDFVLPYFIFSSYYLKFQYLTPCPSLSSGEVTGRGQLGSFLVVVMRGVSLIMES
jgi:hypothetical protein